MRAISQNVTIKLLELAGGAGGAGGGSSSRAACRVGCLGPTEVEFRALNWVPFAAWIGILIAT